MQRAQRCAGGNGCGRIAGQNVVVRVPVLQLRNRVEDIRDGATQPAKEDAKSLACGKKLQLFLCTTTRLSRLSLSSVKASPFHPIRGLRRPKGHVENASQT